MSRRGDFIYTYTGVKFYPLDPRPEDINIEDIAHALSNICRFTGHCKEFYSVAQHSILASELATPENKMWALLHDASEAYLCDVPRPLKYLEGFESFYREAEGELMYAVAERFDLGWPMPDEIHDLDVTMLVTEQRDLMPQSGEPWYPVQAVNRIIQPRLAPVAKCSFLMAFALLGGAVTA